jgi:hypothetical protein
MATSIEHCNRALNLIGSSPIASFQEATDKSSTASAQYETTLNMLLAMAHWRFASKKVQLARLLASPVSYWQYAYQMPADMIAGPDAVYNTSVVGASPIVTGYDIFERTLMTNEAAIYVDYRYRPLESNFPAWFGSLLELALAAKFAKGVTDQDDLAKEYFARTFGTPVENMRGGFFAVCAQINRQGSGPKTLQTGELIASRNTL